MTAPAASQAAAGHPAQEFSLAKYRKLQRGAPVTTPTEALLEELRRLYGESAVQRDVFGRRIALPSEIARTLNKGQRK
jgi:hypothetical protein